jgi:hypothetical protein
MVVKVEFELPFKRADVWKEIVKPDAPLGVPGKARTNFVKAGDVEDQKISKGAVRELSLEGQSWKAEVVEFRELEMLMWEVLEQTNAALTMVGRSDSAEAKPRTYIALADVVLGTRVTLGYDAKQFKGQNLLADTFTDGSGVVKKSLADAAAAWCRDMTSRGYSELRPADAEMGDKIEVTFSLPYARMDVYKECIKVKSPLGADDVTFEVVGDHPKPEQAESLAVGLKRKSVLPAMSDVKLVNTKVSVVEKLVEGTYLAWKDVDFDVQPGSLYFEGAGSKPPLVSILLADADDGTMVRLRYDFSAMKVRPPQGALACIATCLNDTRKMRQQMAASFDSTNLASKWSKSMASRGYTKVGEAPKAEPAATADAATAEQPAAAPSEPTAAASSTAADADTATAKPLEA